MAFTNLGTKLIASTLSSYSFQNCIVNTLQYCWGMYLFALKIVILSIKERSCIMFVLAVVVVILLLALAGSDLFVSQYSPDELSNMGVQEK